MATRLYFHNAANSLPGTFPAGEQSAAAVTGTSTATGANTLRTMNPAIGSTQASLAVTTAASTVAQNNFMGFFCSRPLQGNQTVGGGTMILNGAENESNASANWWINSLNIYVWRPSTGARVGVVRDAAGTSLGGLEPTATGNNQVSHITGITSTAIAALSGDVIICEIWIRATQGAAMSYTGTFFYDGATVNTTENAVVTSHASFIELNENLIFEGAGERTFVVIV